MSSLKLSVLDQSPIAEGSTGAQALRNTIDLARLTESLGYHRYWVAEHHATGMLAGASPEVLLAAIGAATTHMRIGSGGVMLPHYSPLKVAESFSVLSGLYGDRIDLGVGRAPGSDPGTAFALQRDRRYAAIDDFPEQLAELMAYLHASFPHGHPLARLSALPGRPESPTLWLLGSSPQSAIWAAELGLPYSFADFINPAGAEIARLYRDRYVPSPAHPDPELAIAVSTICAETDDEAEHLASSSRMAITLLRRGRPGPVPPVDKAIEFLSHLVPSELSLNGRRLVVGSPERVRVGLEEVAAEYDAGEVAVVTITYDHAARRRSYELIASAFGL